MAHEAFARGSSGRVRALYLHVPFCASRCRYCDFPTSAIRHGDPFMGRYAEALEMLMAEAAELGLLSGVETLYVGGGTPTMLGADRLAGLAVTAARLVGRPLLEASFEANPESLGDDVLVAARDAGFTRVSIGVQSLDDRELGALGRIHSAAIARDRVSAAAGSGLDVSVDLMCGIPHQTAGSWERSLSSAIELGAGHLSCYPLAIEEGTAMERLCAAGRLPWPDDDAEADLMGVAERVLGAAGLARYEVASYARPGRRCRQNIAYWTGTEYLGLGYAAASMLGRASYGRLRAAAPDLPALAPDAERFRLKVSSPARELTEAGSLSDVAFEVEQLSAREAAAEDLMLGMRMSRGVSREALEAARPLVGPAALEGAVSRALTSGLARWSPDGADGARLVPTERGWLMGNELYALFWDLAA